MSKKKELNFNDFIDNRDNDIKFTVEELANGLRRVHIVLPGDPLSKQSVRFMTTRYFQNGTHTCLNCNRETSHRKGDVVTYRNKSSFNIDVIIKTYQDSKYEKKQKEYLNMLKSKISSFEPFSSWVIIEKLDLVFPMLSSFSKTIKTAIMNGEIVHKVTKPDLPDNCKKFILDVLSGFIYSDDNIICEERFTRKRYGIKSYTEIILLGK